MVGLAPLNTEDKHRDIEGYLCDFLEKCPLEVGGPFLRDLGFEAWPGRVVTRDHNLRRVSYDVVMDPATFIPVMRNIRVG